MNYTAEMDRILAGYQSTSRAVQARFHDADARATRGGTELFADLRRQIAERDQRQQAETPQERATREAREERDRLLRETNERAQAAAAERANGPVHGRQAYAAPSDWTDEDEAMADGAPTSWLEY
jgi:hypothetical protein